MSALSESVHWVPRNDGRVDWGTGEPLQPQGRGHVLSTLREDARTRPPPVCLSTSTKTHNPLTRPPDDTRHAALNHDRVYTYGRLIEDRFAG